MKSRLAALFAATVLIATSLPGVSVGAITKSEVDAACTDSQKAYDAYGTARASFVEAAGELEDANQGLLDAEYQERRIREAFDARQTDQAQLEDTVETQAAELYMQSVGNSSIGVVVLSSPEDALVRFEFLNSSAQRNFQVVDDLAAVSGELDRLGSDLEAAVSELTQIRDKQETFTADQEQAMSAALTAYEGLSDRCKQAQSDYEAEQARLRAEEEARKQREAAAQERASSGGSGGGSGGGTVSGIICPFTPGRTQFTNSWGAPRSGGRSHKGVDMMAPWDEPIYAVASGTVTTGNYGLGGKIIWLTSDTGSAFYYAHLNGFAVGSGTRVSKGDLIGYNGNSGNAAGASPHVHFQIHPGGRSSGAVNPYNTVAAVCF